MSTDTLVELALDPMALGDYLTTSSGPEEPEAPETPGTPKPEPDILFVTPR